MTHRNKKSGVKIINEEPIGCEKYKERYKKEMKSSSNRSNTTTNPKRVVSNTPRQPSYNLCQLNGNRPIQENIPYDNPRSCENLQSEDDTASFQHSVSTTSRHRSRSATGNHEPWGKLLKSERNTDRSSIFGNFDPLRTLHFLVKELQIQLKTVLPEDNNILQIALDIKQALNRVPPEVASTIHLQQAFDQLSSRKGSRTSLEVPEKLKSVSEKAVQVSVITDEYADIQKMMFENSMKLEESCRQMENLCVSLKVEKEDLEKKLQLERQNIMFYKNQIAELETIKNLFKPNMKILEKEREELKMELEKLKVTHETEILTKTNALRSEIFELKSKKNQLDQENSKLKHQLKLYGFENSKYTSVLNIKDQQISVMKNELTKLQEVMNKRFLSFQKNINSLASDVPWKQPPNEGDNNKENVGDNNKDNVGNLSISSILSDKNDNMQNFRPKPQAMFKELASGDVDESEVFLDEHKKSDKIVPF